jgi:hypothetical protein
MTYKSLVPILFIFILLNCNSGDDPCDGKPTYTLNETIVNDFGSFNQSSIWIYKDSISGIFDTVRVLDYKRKISNVIFGGKSCGRNPKCDYKTEEITYKYSGKLIEICNKIGITFYDSNGIYNINSPQYYYSGFHCNENGIFNIEFSEGEYVGYEKKIDSTNIGIYKYDSVYKTKTPFSLYDQVYIKSSVGILKIKNINYIWELYSCVK